MNRELPKLLRAIRDRFASNRAMAAAMGGITESRLSRAMRGENTLNVLNCLRLARAAGEPAPTLLRAAGKSEIADLLEELYGQATPAVPPDVAIALSRYQSLTPSKRRHIDESLKLLAVREPPGPKHGHRSKTR